MVSLLSLPAVVWLHIQYLKYVMGYVDLDHFDCLGIEGLPATATYVRLVRECGYLLVPSDRNELAFVQEVHDSSHLGIAAVSHVLHAAAIHVVPDLGIGRYKNFN